jgi:hypothetical protein
MLREDNIAFIRESSEPVSRPEIEVPLYRKLRETVRTGINGTISPAYVAELLTWDGPRGPPQPPRTGFGISRNLLSVQAVRESGVGGGQILQREGTEIAMIVVTSRIVSEERT